MKQIIAIVLLLSAVLLHGADPAAEQKVQDYFAAIKKGDPAGLVALAHPQTLSGFRQSIQKFFLYAMKQNPEQARIEWFPFTEGQSISEIQALSDQEFVRRYFELQIPPEVQLLLRNMTYEIIGSVPEGQDEHFLVRVGQKLENGATQTKLTVVTTRPSNGEPMIVLPDDFASLAGI